MFAVLVTAVACCALLLVGPACATHENGQIWLDENKEKEGVIAMPSGLQYKIMKRGFGAYHPAHDAMTHCHYVGRLTDDTEFDNTYDTGSPSAFKADNVIKGWAEAMQMMVEGDIWEMYLPSELAFGDEEYHPMKPGDPIIYLMEMVKIKGDKVPAWGDCNVTTLDGCSETETEFLTKYPEPEAAPKELNRLKKVAKKEKEEEEGDAADVDWLMKRIRLLTGRQKELKKVADAAAEAVKEEERYDKAKAAEEQEEMEKAEQEEKEKDEL